MARGQLDLAAALIKPLLDIADDPEYRAAHAATEDEFTLASALIGARSRAGLSQTELAVLVNVSHDVISKIETGERAPAKSGDGRIASGLT